MQHGDKDQAGSRHVLDSSPCGSCLPEESGNQPRPELKQEVPESNFSDYIIYADESGDHGLVSIDPQYPAFALVFCIISKQNYTDTIVPAIQDLKFRYWGHDTTVLHEHEIRKEKGAFSFFRTNRELRQNFIADLTEVMDDAPIKIVASIINKASLQNRYATPYSPYSLSLLFCLEQLFDFLAAHGQERKTVHVVFESRGPREDGRLKLEFDHICKENQNWGKGRRNFKRISFESCFPKKPSNSTGLQLADLVARPIALRYFKPNQANRAYEIIRSKIISRKVFPHGF